MHARARLGIGYLPQEASVFRKLSVADNILRDPRSCAASLQAADAPGAMLERLLG